MALDFGLFYELPILNPTRERELAHFQALIDQVKTGEEVGFTSVWHVEHHFLREFSHSSNNDVILGAYAAATETMRIGYGVKLLPFGYNNHPVRAAEAVATLDLMSGGRVEFGSGRGLSRLELEGFDIDPGTAREEWRESLDMIVGCWEDKEFSWDSPSFQIPPRHVVPKPCQDPHPPMWMAATGPDSQVLAGELGLGLLSFVVAVPLEELARRVGLYRDGITRCHQPVGKFINNKVAAFTPIFCGETDEEAREMAAKSVEWYIQSVVELGTGLAKWIENKHAPTYDYIKNFAGFDPSGLTFDFLDANDFVIVGDPDTCIKKVGKYAETGIDTLLGLFQGPGVPLDQVKASIRRFGAEVIPAFR